MRVKRPCKDRVEGRGKRAEYGLEPAPDLHRRRIGRTPAARAARGRLEILVVAKPQLLEPSALVEHDADMFGLPQAVGLRERLADLASGESLAARQAVEVGPAQAAPQRPNGAEVVFRPAR